MSAVVLLLVSTAVLPAASARAADADRLDLPQGVRFKPAPAAVNDAARKRRAGAFAAPDGKAFASLFARAPVICGPGLWQWVKQAPGAMKVGTMSPFLVPLGDTGDVANSERLEGRPYFKKAGARTFLEDPLVVVEIGGHNLIVVLSSKEKTILWIDDLAGASYQSGKGIVLPAAPRYVARR